MVRFAAASEITRKTVQWRGGMSEGKAFQKRAAATGNAHGRQSSIAVLK